jgi:protein TonB
MKPEKILESDMLDIIFENRNKEYGAYELRKNYNSRAMKALGITALIAVMFGVMQGFKTPGKKGTITDLVLKGEVILADIDKPKKEKEKEEQPKEKEKEPVKEKKVDQPMDFKVLPNTVPDIVKDNLVTDPIPTNVDLDNNGIGKKYKDGKTGGPGEEPSDGKDKTGETSETLVEPSGPVTIAEFMPQFPGGKDAFLKFMQKHLRQPDDLEDGQKVVVIAKFVVNTEGEIVDIDITQNGRKDLDEEVIRVIKKMPRWVPGTQNGRKVSVYYKVPVTFVAQE